MSSISPLVKNSIAQARQLFEAERCELNEFGHSKVNRDISMISDRIPLNNGTFYTVCLTWLGIKDTWGKYVTEWKPQIKVDLSIGRGIKIEDIEKTVSTPGKAIEFFRENRPVK